MTLLTRDNDASTRAAVERGRAISDGQNFARLQIAASFATTRGPITFPMGFVFYRIGPPPDLKVDLLDPECRSAADLKCDHSEVGDARLLLLNGSDGSNGSTWIKQKIKSVKIRLIRVIRVL